MSIQSEIDRITNNVQTTLNTIAETGVEVGAGSDALPAAAAALANEKAPINHTHDAESIGPLPVIALESADGETYTATVPWITELAPGVRFTAVAKMASTTTGPLLNVNGLGSKGLRCLTGVGTASAYLGVSEGWVMANKALDIMYTGSAWAVLNCQRVSAEAIMGTVGIDKGGTGASTAAAALTNLGAMPVAGGTFTGAVKAGTASTSGYYARNIKFSDTAETPTSEGDICFKLK